MSLFQSQPSRRLSFGLDQSRLMSGLNKDLQVAMDNGFDFICAPVYHSRFKTELLQLLSGDECKNRPGTMTRSDLVLNSKDLNTVIVGKLSPYIVVDSKLETVRKLCELIFSQDIEYCIHLGLSAIMIDVNRPYQMNLARLLSNKLNSSDCCFTAWLTVPMEAPKPSSDNYNSDIPENVEPCKENDTWEWWNAFRATCNFHKKLGLALILPANIPSDNEIDRWLGEPLKCLIVPTSLFVTNEKGFPVLSRPHQILLIKFADALDLQLVVQDDSQHGDLKPYQVYLESIWKNPVTPDPQLEVAEGYEGDLQSPLHQPLMVDVDESQTCYDEAFEKDSAKYGEYQRAIYTAMMDKVPAEMKDEVSLTVMVVGAGQGPLVQAALNAANKADRKVHVYAVEKNAYAVVTLQAQQEELWGDQVTIISSDAREWHPPEKADILVSELLEPRNNNELSPECLDGAQRLLKDEIINNSRYKKMQFSINRNCILHGFYCYFSAVLYNNITLTIEPVELKNCAPPGMSSCSFMFFPMIDAVHLRAGEEFTVKFWQVCAPKNMWYECCVSTSVPLPLHNPNGQSCSAVL